MVARFFADVAVQKFAERPLANEADARRVFFPSVGQADLFGNAAHLGLVQLTDREQRFGQLRLVQAVQKVTLVFAGVQSLEQLVSARLGIQPNPSVMAGGDFLGPQAHGVVQKRLELDLGVAQDVGVGRAPSLVFAHKLGKNPVFVIGRKIDMLDLDAQHIGHGRGVDEVNVG
jgi:hypothetical protein